MTVLEVGLGLALTISIIWWTVDHLFKIIRIEELEAEINIYELGKKELNTLYGIYGRKR